MVRYKISGRCLFQYPDGMVYCMGAIWDCIISDMDGFAIVF